MQRLILSLSYDGGLENTPVKLNNFDSREDHMRP